MYKEEYIAGKISSNGYIKSYLKKVKVPCASLSLHQPVRRYRHHHNHVHHFFHSHRSYDRPTHQRVLVPRTFRTSSRSYESSSTTTTGGLIRGDLAAALSKKDPYGWSIPLGAVLGMGIANADF